MKPKPVRGIENLDLNKQYFEVGALNPSCMWIDAVLRITGEPFVPSYCKERGENKIFFIPTQRRGSAYEISLHISLHDYFVIGEEPYNNHRLFEYTPEAYAFLKDLVERGAFEEYRELIGSTHPAHS
ncbi:MAG: hypothetical protein Q8P49_01120 [Candidatus Liptonbacteria bacterium]|nr:hypothetical protein [Candidatus Liptonbacteria bacterium]